MSRTGIIVLGVLALAGTYRAHAQLTAQITGTVSDGSGAVIPSVSVTVVNEDTGIKWESTTNESGLYIVPLLQPGRYRISAQQQGFRGTTRSGVRLEVAQTATVNFTL